jgi:hypothetical protein
MTRRVAVTLLAIILGVALIEWIAAARAYRTLISPEDWAALADASAALPEDEPILLAQPWLGPRARLEVPALTRAPSLAPPDLVGFRRFHVLGLAGHRWHDTLGDDLGGLPAPTIVGEHEYGPLRLVHYEQPGAGELVSSWIDPEVDLEVHDERGRCRGRRGTWSCKQGKIAVETLEIAYRPRRCLALRVNDGARVRVGLPEMRLGHELRGHLGFSDFNARLRSDAPVLLILRVDGVVTARWTFTDAQGWAGFAASTEPGVHAVELEFITTRSGVWQGVRYDPRPTHIPCVELRALTEGGE